MDPSPRRAVATPPLGPSAQLGALGVQWEFGDDLFVRLVGNAGTAGEFGLSSLLFFRVGAGLTLGALTRVGPASVTLSSSDLASWPEISVSLGHPF